MCEQVRHFHHPCSNRILRKWFWDLGVIKINSTNSTKQSVAYIHLFIHHLLSTQNVPGTVKEQKVWLQPLPLRSSRLGAVLPWKRFKELMKKEKNKKQGSKTIRTKEQRHHLHIYFPPYFLPSQLIHSNSVLNSIKLSPQSKKYNKKEKRNWDRAYSYKKCPFLVMWV